MTFSSPWSSFVANILQLNKDIFEEFFNHLRYYLRYLAISSVNRYILLSISIKGSGNSKDVLLFWFDFSFASMKSLKCYGKTKKVGIHYSCLLFGNYRNPCSRGIAAKFICIYFPNIRYIF